MKQILLIFALMYGAICNAGLLTNPAYSWHPCNVWHSAFYPDDNEHNKPITTSPEPTSAMLIAIGAAALALKRKNKINV